MDKDLIKRQAYQRMIQVEEHQVDGYVIPEIQSWWLLNFLIAEGFEGYFSSYGFVAIEQRQASEGRALMGLGSLSQFEREALVLLEQKVTQKESVNSNRKRFLPISNYSQSR